MMVAENQLSVNKQLKMLKRIFRLLQLFCEGHNLKLQNYLRQQIINGQQIRMSNDFISMSSALFANITMVVNCKCADLTDQLLDFLIECVQGPCLENQLDLCQSQIISSCKDFFKNFTKSSYYKKFGFETDD